MVNSRTSEFGEKIAGYLTSAPQDSQWGQPPASNYIFRSKGRFLEGYLITGSYICAQPIEFINSGTDPMLMAEFEAWEAASDEDMGSLNLGSD